MSYELNRIEFDYHFELHGSNVNRLNSSEQFYISHQFGMVQSADKLHPQFRLEALSSSHVARAAAVPLTDSALYDPLDAVGEREATRGRGVASVAADVGISGRVRPNEAGLGVV